MRRNPVYAFENRNSYGISSVPLNSTIHVRDNGDGNPEYVEIISKEGLNSGSTIGDFLDRPELYVDLTADVTFFTKLLDTPDDYIGAGGNLVIVDDNESSINFSDILDGGTYQGTTGGGREITRLSSSNFQKVEKKQSRTDEIQRSHSSDKGIKKPSTLRRRRR